MEDDKISHLAAMLRENGDKVLNSSSKLTLSTDMLHNLNNLFNLINEQRDAMSSSFHVVTSPSSNKGEIFRDLQFLYDFMQRTTNLKLVASTTSPSANVLDLCNLANLKYLELHKLKLNRIKGLKNLRTQLQFLICERIGANLKELLIKCGADDMPGFIWCELKEFGFTHSSLVNIDNSFEYTPWLHTLDLSHNLIKDPAPLNCLPNLKYLNLAYNHLERAPSFTGQLCNRLQVLILRNNFIEDLRDVMTVSNLCELDLSGNCLLQHDSLAPVAYLAALQCLNLLGNPLSFHPQHRMKAAKYLHSNTATVRFFLDGVLLSKSESKYVGSLHLIHPSHSSSLANYSSFCSVGTESTIVAERPRRVRHAEIADGDDTTDMEISFHSISSLVTSSDHLETKRKIEELREKFGDSWMQSQGAFMLQETLGLEHTPVPLLSSSPYGKEFLLHANEVKYEPKEKEKDVTSERSTINTFSTANEESAASEESLYGGARVDSSESSTDDEDLGDGEENLYLATIAGESEPVFVVLTDTHLCERECTGGKERFRWPLESLLSCELLGDNCTKVRLEYDTMRRDKKLREYELEVEEATRLSSVLKNILVNRPLRDSKLLVYRCMKCSTQFSQDSSIKGRELSTIACPVCESTLVIEDDEQLKI